MTKDRFRIGIVGLQPGKSWAALAHVPALRALPDDFEIKGVANTNLASAAKAAAAYNIPTAFGSAEELIQSPDVDIVAVTVRVPYHFDIVLAAIEAGKHVICEWPLGNGLAEAETMAARARARGVLAISGNQALFAPEILFLKQLLADRFVGEILSSTLIASGGTWGAEIDQSNAYILDRSNGATMLTIPFGHTMYGICGVLGPLADVSARLLTRRTTARIVETNQMRPMTAPDQILLEGVFASGVPLSVHYRGGLSRGTNLQWEINGTDGDLCITGKIGYLQWTPLTISGAHGADTSLHPVGLPVPDNADWPVKYFPANVTRLYQSVAADLRMGTQTAPTFEDAVTIHRLIEAMEVSDRTGHRVSVSSKVTTRVAENSR